MTISNSVDAGALQEFIDRLVLKEEQRRTVSEDIRDILQEASSTGYEAHAIKAIVRKQLMDDKKRAREKLTYRRCVCIRRRIQNLRGQ